MIGELWASPDPKGGAWPPPERADALRPAAARNRVLILEDDAIVAFALENILGEAGYDVVGVCARGEQAASMAERQRPDLVIADVRLAGAMDGIAAVAAIRARVALRVIFLTAHTDAGTRERMLAQSPDEILAKPSPDAVLLDAIATVLKN